MLTELNTWSCLDIRIEDEVTINELIIVACKERRFQIHEEIKSRLKSGNACYHSVQDILYSSFILQNWNDEDTQKYNIACCFVWVWNSSFTLKEERRLREFDVRLLRRIFEPKCGEVTGDWENKIVRSLVIYIHHKIFFGFSSQEEWFGRFMNHVWGRGEKNTGIW
jgi:hypothetical protein